MQDFDHQPYHRNAGRLFWASRGCLTQRLRAATMASARCKEASESSGAFVSRSLAGGAQRGRPKGGFRVWGFRALGV